MADSPTKKKVRSRRVDPLQDAMEQISSGSLEQLKTLLSDDELTAAFSERLAADRTPKGHSPLVLAILKNSYDIFEYILDTLHPNLEQATSAVIEGGYPVEGATALWTASTLGRLSFVKLLVSRGADIEHTTDSKSSPLRGAAFDGHCDVCEYLIDHSADIDKPNQVGQSPLTIAAAMQKIDCVKLLIKKGADVNHKGHNGDTPLHVSVESGAVETAKVLVEAGAGNKPNDVGFTPAILACCYGHNEVMEFLNSKFDLPAKELYDCYCLLAAKHVLGGNEPEALQWMTKAVAIRASHPDDFKELPAAAAVYEDLQEPTNDIEVSHVMQDEKRMFFVSSIYCERILGRIHPTTAFYIRISGDMALAEEHFSKCIELWHRSLDFDNAARVAYELQITEDLLFSIRGFSIMADNGFTPPVEPHFRWGLKEFRLAHESKISEVDVVCCLCRMIAVWFKVAEAMEDPLIRKEEVELITSSTLDMMRLMDSKSCPMLIACLHNVSDKSTSGAGQEIIKSGLPLQKTIALLLESGCTTHCEDDMGNFPLHLAVSLADDSSLDCIRTLLEYGAHVDAVNLDGKTALDLAKEDVGCKKLKEAIQEELLRASHQYMSLQCLAACAILSHEVDYSGVLPKKLVKIVSWHESDPKTNICHGNESSESS